MRHKVLFRVGWKHILGIPGFENMSHGNTLCCKSRMESYFSLVLWLFILLFMIFYVLN